MIKRIFHTADIHIPKSQPYVVGVPFNEQPMNAPHHFFLQFIANIKKAEIDYFGARIVIAGDLYHDFNKIENSPIVYMKEAIIELLKLHPVIIIAGNHDCNDNNHNQMDTLSMLETSINGTPNSDNFKFYRSTECIEDENIVWCVYSRFDSKEKPDIESAKLLYGNEKHYLGLYHDPIQYCLDFNGKPLKGNHTFPEISIFEGLDYCLMGDIHSHQVLQFNGGKAVYSGSPWQQNVGETIDGHGYVEWTIMPKKSAIKFKHIALDNLYAIVKVFIEKPSDIAYDKYFISNLKDKKFKYNISRVVVKWTAPYMDFTTDAIDELRLNVRSKWGVDMLSGDLEKRFVNTYLDEQKNEEAISHSLINSNMLSEFNSEFLKENYKDVVESEITQIDSVVLKNLDKKEVLPSAKKWKVERFEGYNLFCFEHVKHDFKKGLTYVESTPSNQGGKTFFTHLVHLLMYGDKLKFSDDAINYKEVFNLHLSSEKEAYIWGVIKMDGHRYVLSRVFKRKGDKVTHHFDLLQIHNEGTDILRGLKGFILNEKSAVNTTQKVEEIFGTYKEFSFSSFYNSENISKWIMVKGKERYDLLSSYLGLGVLGEKFEIAKKLRADHKENSILSKYKFETLVEECDIKEAEFQNVSNEVKVKESELDQIEKEIAALQTLIATQNSLLRPIKEIDGVLVNNNLNKSMELLEELQLDKLKIEQFIFENQQKFRESEGEYENLPSSNPEKFSDLLAELKIIEAKLYNIKPDELLSKEQENAQNFLNKLLLQHSLVKDRIVGLRKQIEEVPTKFHCQRCDTIFDDNSAQREELENTKKGLETELLTLQEQGKSQRSLLNDLALKIEKSISEQRASLQISFDNIQADYEAKKKQSDAIFLKKMKELSNFINSFKQEVANINLINDRIKIVEEDVATLKKLQEEHNKQLENVKWNSTFVAQIESLNSNLAILQEKKYAISSELKHLTEKSVYIDEMIKGYNEKIELHQKASKMDRLYQAYLDLHSDEGVSKTIINHILPALNHELSLLTEQLADITVYMKCEEKGIKFYYKRHGKENQLKYASGFEKTVACLAIHSVCMKNTLIPTSNILCLDEILAGTVAEANISKMEEVLRHLNSIYESIYIVSHNTPDVKNWCDYTIQIKNTKGIANVL